MKNKYTFHAIIFHAIMITSVFSAKAQVPQGINYQAVARNSAGDILPNQNVSVRLSIHDSGSTGNIVYQETDAITTNQFGLFTVVIGAGTVTQGTFSSINWSTGNKFLQVEFDPTGGANYVNLNTSELESVPYALYSGSGNFIQNQSTAQPFSDFDISGYGTIGHDLKVFGTATIEGNTTIGGNTNLEGNATISDNTTIGENVSVDKNAYIDGSVGIGTNAPVAALELYSSNTSGTGKEVVWSPDLSWGQIQVANPSTNAETSIGFISGATGVGDNPTSINGTSNVWSIGAGNFAIGGDKFGIGNQEYNGVIMAITSAGDVGIGTTTPATTLEVNGNAFIDSSLDVDQYANNIGTISNALTFGYVGGGEGIGSNRNIGYPNQYGLDFYTDFNNRMSISQAGNVGIGNNNPATLLEVGSITTTTGKIVSWSQDNVFGQLQVANSASNGEASIAFISGATIVGSAPSSVNGTSNIWAAGAGSFGIGGNNFAIGTQGLGAIMTLSSIGNMGVGTNTPNYPLDVEGTTASIGTLLAGSYVMSPGGPGGSPCYNCVVDDISIWAAGNIVGASIYAMSDARIKEIAGLSDNRHDLETLLHLRVTDYHYIDKVAHSAKSNKGFIAQQVEEIYPEAVNKSVNYIPNIFAKAEQSDYSEATQTLTITLSKSHDLVKGDMVRIMTSEGTKEAPVDAVPLANSFTVKNWTAGSKEVFVYGKQVKDFRTVDYDRIFTLAVSSVQELSKQVDLLKIENTELKAKLTEVESSNALMKSAKADATEVNQDISQLKMRLAVLEQLMEKNGIRSEK